jgi:hypothetical protein
VDSRIDPRHIVPSHENTLIALGTATRNDSAENTSVVRYDWPATNMWWPHTRNPSAAIARLDMAMNV